jgi:hypothetical protein
MKTLFLSAIIAVSLAASARAESNRFTDTFVVDPAELVSSGTNRFFNLTPGFQLTLANKSQSKVLVITVLAETKMIDGIETRIVEEKETENGQLAEISRNYFAISKRTQDVYYFGEDVDLYKNGKVSNHEGSWQSGAAGAHFGLMMPGTPLLGSRFQQEVAPKVAMDRAEIVGLTESIKTAAGAFTGCVRIDETTPLEPGKESKVYAPGVGVVSDDDLRLIKISP